MWILIILLLKDYFDQVVHCLPIYESSCSQINMSVHEIVVFMAQPISEGSVIRAFTAYTHKLKI